MSIVRTIARILLGLLFVAAGAAGLLIAPPPQPGLAGEFSTVVYASHFMNFVSAAQLLLGVLLLINRFVPVALIMLAAFIYNSLAFHSTMAQSAIVAPFVVAALLVVVAWPYRALFAPLFVARPLRTGQARCEESGHRPRPSVVGTSQ
jgi:putative oxidoreductase